MIFFRLADENLSPAELHNAAHDLLKDVLSDRYGISDIRTEKGAHGKPYLADYPHIHFNLSHCRGLVLCGVSDMPIGVDAELIREYNGRAANRVCSESERAQIHSDEDFFRFWTLKEALVKNLGTGLSSDLSKICFSIEGENPKCGAYPEKFFMQKIIEKKWVISVCADNPCF